MKKILLIGNPNVGKSVIFSRLTGIKVIVSNYPGSTVEYTKGYIYIDNEKYMVIDVPGIYSLDASSEAEKVAVNIIDETIKNNENFVVLNVIDSTNLERNLNLTLQLIKKKIPIISVLNFWDETKHRGIKIDPQKLSKLLDFSFIPTVAVIGAGIKELVSRIKGVQPGTFDYEEEERWHVIGDIVSNVQKLHHHHHTLLQRLEEISIHPYTGIPIAIIILLCVFIIIRFIGEGLITYVGEPLFNYLWTPVVMQASYLFGGKGILHDVIIGRLVDGQIDYTQSLGLITTGLFVPLVSVLPYIFAFYLILSFLEDFGYLPRLSVLVDNLMHKLGVHGYSIVPFMLGLGCNVPGALATRIMETKRERFIAATLMAIAIPCMAQLAMISGLLGKYGIKGLGIVLLTLFIVWLILGVILNKFIKGNAPELFIEIPPYRFPYIGALIKKVWMRIFWFLREALPWVLFGVLLINMLYFLGIIDFIGRLMAPLISGIFGLPTGAVGALIVGFLRKDVAIGMLMPLNLSLKQLIIASVVLTMYFPCIATFSTFFKEFGAKDTFKSIGIMILSTILIGGILNIIL